VDCEHTGHGAIPTESFGACPRRGLTAAPRDLHQLHDSPGEGSWAGRDRDAAARGYEFGGAAAHGYHDRGAARHRFEGRETEGFSRAGGDHRIGGRHLAGEHGSIGEVSEEIHRQAGGPAAQLVGHRTGAGDRQAGIDAPVDQRSECADRQLGAFLR